MNTEKIADFVSALQTISATTHDGSPISPELKEDARTGLQQLLAVLKVVRHAQRKVERDAEVATDGVRDTLNMASFALDAVKNSGERGDGFDQQMDRNLHAMFDAYDGLRGAEADAWREALR